jgi:hypothetical protein
MLNVELKLERLMFESTFIECGAVNFDLKFQSPAKHNKEVICHKIIKIMPRILIKNYFCREFQEYDH